jgi:hypothetical protein
VQRYTPALLQPWVDSARKFGLTDIAFTDLFLKFDLSACQQIFSWSRLALWDGPYAVIFAGEEWSARMRQKNFDLILLAPEHDQTGADATSFRFRVFPHSVILRGNLFSAFCRKTRSCHFLSPHK